MALSPCKEVPRFSFSSFREPGFSEKPRFDSLASFVFRIASASAAWLIRGWLPDLDGIQPAMDHASGYLPEPIWKNTRGYIEEVCRELNGSFHHADYNAAAVMLRRLLETLIIEAYEHLGRGAEIKDGGGNYFMLSDLAERVCGEKGHKGLNLGRDSKKALKEARSVGNWSAHAHRFLAHAGDLTSFKPG